MRCSLTISYNGTHFLGSQTQKSSNNTILGQLEYVLREINIECKVIASGRTDKGVHATGQVCHIDLPEFWNDLAKLKKVLNEMLPKSIHVKSIKEVDDGFHARYSAKKRLYRYIIKEAQSNPFEDDFITFLDDVNFLKIEKNIKLFCGTYDFKYFMKTGSDINSTCRTVYKAFAYKHKGYIVLTFEANGFLRSQIRLMVGALLNLNEKEILEQLECRNNYKIKPAKCNGLYLAKIKY
ncbi:MAG: tRNA pseudouridine(38-40) synthase TruA [Sulfurimonas sp.]|uniref:tRNA pseudouridine(38-40) synthase TruA n=1 Tax=Sulfurimonas sp. TaxID=2022749 RepID=UPI0026374BE5|nr:tRNA pseudouridine(38-40) synthase TruA [Sulfurimonas sp.]MCW8895046.1 tRNA pseudouridine(38-40) synthase TruA [Sulfurimonas sp.]MCW8953622.1 tRNA pseudouridine(38-40) synthase TruA [Sulfurimonas sp.]MCW9067335.1 tRNA pseudouridine(38-40) synthase TruA [Sulfurimonas sp.]